MIFTWIFLSFHMNMQNARPRAFLYAYIFFMYDHVFLYEYIFFI